MKIWHSSIQNGNNTEFGDSTTKVTSVDTCACKILFKISHKFYFCSKPLLKNTFIVIDAVPVNGSYFINRMLFISDLLPIEINKLIDSNAFQSKIQPT